MVTASEQAVARHRSLYQRLLWLYPASFRRDYGEAMVQVFCDRLRDEARHRPRAAAVRAWRQTLGDLARSVPDQRIEVFMSEQQTTARLVAVIVAVSLSIAAIAFIGIGIPAVALFAAVAAWLVYQRRRGRYVGLPGQSKWYRWVLSGVAALAVGFLPLILSLDGDKVWGLSLLIVPGFLAVAAGVAMGVRDLRQHRGRVTPA